MATGTFTYDALRTKTLKERNTKNCKSFKLDKSNAVGVGMTAIKPYLSICTVGLVCFTRYCGKMYSLHLFSLRWITVSKALLKQKRHVIVISIFQFIQ